MNTNNSESSLISTINDEMVEIPGGKIELRDDRTKLKWTVDIEPFFLAKFPVTQEIYFEVTKEKPATFKGEDRPVETVTWKDAIIFCNSLSVQTGLNPCYIFNENEEEITFNMAANGFRLPTEAE